MSFDLSSMSLDLSSISCDPRVKTIFVRPPFHLTCQEFHLTPVSIVALGWNETFFSRPVLKYFLVGNLKHFVSFMSFDLSSMSLDPSSMSCDPRVTTIFRRPLFHWTCPVFHLTPVSIVALGWHETFSLAPC
ncbi:hypothetical protein TNCV_3800191 [Trichonephila clavipes]|nr:hypothetical protein TNCV_3800191 [Trichonephila clavipes]